MFQPCVYILSNVHHTVFYIGSTTNLPQRHGQHTAGIASSFTKKYNVYKLLYVLPCDTIEQMALQEKLIKKWSRAIKFDVITKQNPDWRDLSQEWL